MFLYPLAALSLLLSGAIFGFFYAWICSTMWGLDAADPQVAIAAMQAMNASVRNVAFAPAFFGTPVILAATAIAAVAAGRRTAAGTFALAGLIYLGGGMVLTMLVNVPMNQALAATAIPADPAKAARIWAEYSQPWQFWNAIRTGMSGLALLLTGYAILRLRD